MFFELVKPDTHIDFIGKRYVAFAISGGLLLASLIAIPVRGIKLGIDFAGGTEMLVKFDPGVSVDEGKLRSVVGSMNGIEGLSVVRYGPKDAPNPEYMLRFQSPIEMRTGGESAKEASADEAAAKEEPGNGEEGLASSDLVAQISKTMGKAIGAHSLERVDFVGPRVGAELRDDGLKALLFASIATLIYVAFRFSSRYAPGAIVASVHDLLITSGVFVMLGLEFNLQLLAALLAILGYSLNDTIIIYDRIRETMELRTKVDLHEVMNESVNQTLSRTVLTSGTTLLAVLALFFLGGEVIRPFAFAMIVGIIVGTYSSIYIASALLLFLEERWGTKRS